MIPVPPYISRALRSWQAWRETRQRQQRFARMLRVDPQLATAHERRCRHIRQHDATAQDLKEMQDRLHTMLRKAARNC
jgi:hypothetical protein